MARTPYDWNLVALNVRTWRIAQNWTQEMLAEKSGLSKGTVFNVERAVPVSRTTLKKLAKGMGLHLSVIHSVQRVFKTREMPYVVSRHGEIGWAPWSDVRTSRKEDDGIYPDAERRRLGTLGLVSHFTTSTRFVMSDGPGIMLIEIFGDNEGEVNSMIYEDAIMYCIEGEAVVTLDEEQIHLKPGDAIGYRSNLLHHMAPAPNFPTEALPVKLLWIGANRVGRIPAADLMSGAEARKVKGTRKT